MTRVDNHGIPRIVQGWRYGGALTFAVDLFNGKTHFFDQWTVREESCMGYQKWDNITDQMAIDHFVEKHLRWFI